MTPAPPPRRVAPRPKAPPKPALTAARVSKKFEVVEWTGQGEGEKIVIYGPSGVGKTTLASLLQEHVAKRVIVLGLDDGGRKIRNPNTGKPLQYVPNVDTFEDVRDVLQCELFKTGDCVVLDTITKLEAVAEAYLLRTLKTEKNLVAKNLEAYGFGKGYKHLLDSIRLVLADFDALVRRGVHVVLLAQESAAKIANAEGLDYLQDGPKLWHSNQYSNRLEICEWADHVLRIGYHGTTVVPEATMGNTAPRKGKIVGETQRAVYTANALHFFAKSRTMTDPVVSFEEPTDDTIWQILFGDRK